MKLKARIQSLDEVDSKFHDLYTKISDGEYVLDVEDGDFKSRLSEFRNTNITLSKQLEDAKKQAAVAAELQEKLKQFEGIDPEKARELQQQIRDIEEKKLIDSGQIEELFGKRTERMKADYEGKISAMQKQLKELTGERDGFRQNLESVVIDSGLQTEVLKVAAPRPGAMEDILARGRRVWKLGENSQPVPIDTDGKVMYGKDGQTTLSMQEWAQGLMQTAGYLFEPSSGGGGFGNQSNSYSGSESVVLSDDQDAINANLEGIANGSVRVAPRR